MDLHNLFHFLRLRADHHAQYEIRVYADVMCKIVADWVPAAYAAFEDYRMGGGQVSAKGLSALRKMLKGEDVPQETSGMSKGEWREFQALVSYDYYKIEGKLALGMCHKTVTNDAWRKLDHSRHAFLLRSARASPRQNRWRTLSASAPQFLRTASQSRCDLKRSVRACVVQKL